MLARRRGIGGVPPETSVARQSGLEYSRQEESVDGLVCFDEVDDEVDEPHASGGVLLPGDLL